MKWTNTDPRVSGCKRARIIVVWPGGVTWGEVEAHHSWYIQLGEVLTGRSNGAYATDFLNEDDKWEPEWYCMFHPTREELERKAD